MDGRQKGMEAYNFIKILEKLPFIDEIWLFGSRARGDNGPRADIDLAIVCPAATQSDWQRVLEVINNADTLLKIDCIQFDSLKEGDKLRENILKHKRTIFKKAMDELFWKDYFYSLGDALNRLGEVVRHPDVEANEYMQDASIQRFEFVIELFWKVLKKILSYEKLETGTPRDVVSKAFQFKLIDDESVFLKMLDDRNNTSHIYRQEDARRVFENMHIYLPVLEKTYKKLKKQYAL